MISNSRRMAFRHSTGTAVSTTARDMERAEDTSWIRAVTHDRLVREASEQRRAIEVKGGFHFPLL